MQKIMFNDKFGLTKAVLDGIKTKTRRIITIDEEDLTLFQTIYYNQAFDFLEGKDLIEAYFDNYPKKIPYKKGEIVAVAQSYNKIADELRAHQCIMLSSTKSWTNKMFVRPDLMPHQIRINGFHIERLQDISDEDCLAEGIIKGRVGSAETHFMDAYYVPNMPLDPYCLPRDAYAFLINKICGKGTWESNPYVFAYDFKLWK